MYALLRFVPLLATNSALHAIRTIPRKGYEFICPVQHLSTTTSRPLGDADSEPPTPRCQRELDAIPGHCPFDPGENDRIEVTAEKGNVTWTRAGTVGRPLFHIGGRVFYPSGAPAVRISFVAESAGSRMIVCDPDTVLSVLRN